MSEKLRMLRYLLFEEKLSKAPTTTTYHTGHVQAILAIGNDHAATITIDTDSLHELVRVAAPLPDECLSESADTVVGRELIELRQKHFAKTQRIQELEAQLKEQSKIVFHDTKMEENKWYEVKYLIKLNKPVEVFALVPDEADTVCNVCVFEFNAPSPEEEA